MKYSDKEIGIVNHPVLVVGQNPGKQRGHDQERICWQNNRSADFLMEILDPHGNIYLTNACQYRDMTKDHLVEGLSDLQLVLNVLKPRKILTLGAYASLAIDSLQTDIPVVKFHHPSYILRFNKDKIEYARNIRKELAW